MAKPPHSGITSPSSPSSATPPAPPATASPAPRAVARRCLVSGRVQGVYYRASARERARVGGITGYARNLPDGRVEVLACGEEQAVQSFIAWLWIGPGAARVTAVLVEELSLPASELPSEFSAR